MFKQEDSDHHRERYKGRILFPTKKDTSTPDNCHYSQGKRCRDRPAQKPFEQAALYDPVRPRNAKERDRIRHHNDQNGDEHVDQDSRTPEEKRITRCEI
jgi:hypothetical protein